MDFTNRENHRLAAVVGAAFILILLVLAALFSTFLEWRGQSLQYSHDTARGTEPCSAQNSSPQIDETLEVLNPADQAQLDDAEDPSHTQTTLGATEILGLGDNVEAIRGIGPSSLPTTGSQPTDGDGRSPSQSRQ